MTSSPCFDILLHAMTREIPKNLRERRQLNLYVNSEGRVDLLERVREVFPEARSLSDAVFSALEEWLDFGPVGAELEYELSIVATHMQAARQVLAEIDDSELREAVYRKVLGSLLMNDLLSNAILANQDKLNAPFSEQDRKDLLEWFATAHLIEDSDRQARVAKTWEAHFSEIDRGGFMRMREFWRRHKPRFLPTAGIAEQSRGNDE